MHGAKSHYMPNITLKLLLGAAKKELFKSLIGYRQVVANHID